MLKEGLQLWAKLEIKVMLLMGLGVFVFGLIGYHQYFMENLWGTSSLKDTNMFLESLYQTVLLFKATVSIRGELNHWIEAARWLAVILLFLAGIKAVFEIFYKQIQMENLRWFVRNHVIICGYSEKNLLMAQDFIQKGYTVVIMAEEEKEEYQKACRELGIILLEKNPEKANTLLNAKVKKASYLIAVMGDDRKNIEVSINAHKIVNQPENRRSVLLIRSAVKACRSVRDAVIRREKEKSGTVENRLYCIVHVSNNQLRNLLEIQKRDYDLSKCSIEYINMYDMAARELLSTNQVVIDQFSGPEKIPQVLIIGSGKLCETLILHMARNWVSRYLENGKQPIKIYLLSGKAVTIKDSLIARYSKVKQICQLEATDINLNEPEHQALHLSKFFAGSTLRPQDISNVYICMNDDTSCLSCTLTIKQHLSGVTVPVVACTSSDEGYGNLLKFYNEKNSKMGYISSYSIVEHVYKADPVIRCIQKALDKTVIPQAKYEQYVKDHPESGDNTPWDELLEEVREDNREAANAMIKQLENEGYEIIQTDDLHYEFTQIPDGVMEKLAAVEHERWRQKRQREGWKLGEYKDKVNKINPYLVPWPELYLKLKKYESEKEYEKASGFRETIENNLRETGRIPVYLAKAGFQVVPLSAQHKPKIEILQPA